jgi:hypothetical protein
VGAFNSVVGPTGTDGQLTRLQEQALGGRGFGQLGKFDAQEHGCTF